MTMTWMQGGLKGGMGGGSDGMAQTYGEISTAKYEGTDSEETRLSVPNEGTRDRCYNVRYALCVTRHGDHAASGE